MSKPKRIDTIPRGVIPGIAKGEDRQARHAEPAQRAQIDKGISDRAKAADTPVARGVSEKAHNVN